MRRVVVHVFILICLLCRGAGAEEKFIPHFLTEDVSGGANPQLNVVLVHGLFSSHEIWKPWIEQAKAGNVPYRVWTFRYNWDNIADTAARNLAADMLAQHAKFADKPLVLVGHSKGGLVSKAFAWHLIHPGGDFPTAAALGVKPDALRIVYLDVPHGGGNFVNNPFMRLVIATFGALTQGELFGNLGAAEELGRGYGHDPGDTIPSYQLVLARNSKDHDLEVQLKLLGLEHLFGAGKPLYAPIVPFGSAMATKSRAVVMVNAFDLVGANEEIKGAAPTARYYYHGWHGAIARSRKVYDVVFRQIIPGRFTAKKDLPPPANAIAASYQKLLGRAPRPAEVVAQQSMSKSLDDVRADLESTVEFASKSIPKGGAFVAAWERNGGEKSLGRPMESAVEVEPGSGRWVMWMNTPDSTAAALLRTNASGPFLVRGPIAMQYFAVADFNDRYGFPTADEARSGDTVRQTFEKGEMVFQVKSGTVTWQGKQIGAPRQ